MEQRINIAELLKDCPSGMELNCLMYEDVYFDYVDELNIIHCYLQRETHKTSLTFNQHGTPNSDIKSKCVIFPKNKTTWEGFVSPCKFKDGDIVATYSGCYIGIIEVKDNKQVGTYCAIDYKEYFRINPDYIFGRLATEDEKQKLFDAIKENGYKWNEEIKMLEKLVKPKFKVGDIVKSKINQYKYTIADIKKDEYIIYYYGSDKLEYHVPFCNENDFKLVSDKFDITTLVPFKSEVLVRDSTCSIWRPAIFGCIDKSACGLGHYYVLGGICWRYCIPYEGNEHLLGTTQDCNEYYKTWK